MAIKAKKYDASGKESGSADLSEKVFGEDRISEGAIHAVIRAELRNRRQGTHKTKGISEIRGGGKKPWRQKGTGRARAGSSRSPIWRGGGTIFGPHPRSYAYRLPRSARKKALGSALAQKLRDGEMTVVDALGFDEPKTKRMRSLLDALGIQESTLIVLAGRDDNVELSARNLPNVTVLPVDGLNVYDILRHRRLVVVRDAVAGIEERMSR